jgi:hypothetical protein
VAKLADLAIDAVAALRQTIASARARLEERAKAASELGRLGPEYVPEAAAALREIIATPEAGAEPRAMATEWLAALEPAIRKATKLQSLGVRLRWYRASDRRALGQEGASSGVTPPPHPPTAREAHVPAGQTESAVAIVMRQAELFAAELVA